MTDLNDRTPEQWRQWVEAGPDTIDLHSAYMAECRVVFGEERTAELVAKHPMAPVFELAKMGGGMNVYEQVVRGVAKRLLRFLDAHPETWELPLAPPMTEEPGSLQEAMAAASCEFRSDFDPSFSQFAMAFGIVERILGLEQTYDVPDAMLLQPMFQ